MGLQIGGVWIWEASFEMDCDVEKQEGKVYTNSSESK